MAYKRMRTKERIIMLELKNICKSYKIGKKSVSVLKDVTLTLPNQGMIFITGKSGSGKSTLLNMLGCLDYPEQGELVVDGKIIDKTKQKEIDSYRNTYVGFVFQEYHLIDNFNVSQNIAVALDLQKEKADAEKISKILKLVDLENFEKRKVNELSGGEKQRVAIARAIIKNPYMLLADEPTGNLDAENSKQIFDILKRISKETLVVVVTHNVELARQYADRMITIAEGTIASDTAKADEDKCNRTIELKKSGLSFGKSIALSFANLKNKRLNLEITTILLTLSLAIFGFTILLTRFDIDKIHAETMYNQNEGRIEIHKRIEGKNFTDSSAVITLTNAEVEEVEKKIATDVVKVSKAVENNWYLQIQNAMNVESDGKAYAYYELYSSDTLFLEYSEQELNKLKLIGELPNESHEIIIHKVLADYIIQKGVLVWGTDTQGNAIEENYLPKDYDQLLKEEKKLVFGSGYLKISGIIDEDLKKYDRLKYTLLDDMEIRPTKLYEEFKMKYTSKLYEVIVSDTFFETMQLQDNVEMSEEFYKVAYLMGEKRIYSGMGTAYLNRKIRVYDGEKFVEREHLEKNEIILGVSGLDELYDNEYSNRYREYLEEIKKSEQEQGQKLDKSKLMEQFTIDYIKEKQLIGKTISVEVNDLYLRTQNQLTENLGEFKIVGYSFEEINHYLSEDVLKSYMREKSETVSLYFNETDKENLESVFQEFPLKDAKYISKTIYSDTILEVETVVNHILGIAKYISVGMLLFVVLLFTYFTMNSIQRNKKNIGILRALGARVCDIYKIFYLETFLVGMGAFALSSVACYGMTRIANLLISTKVFIDVCPIWFRIDVIVILFIVLVLLMSVSFVLPLYKIAKTRPIHIINGVGGTVD